jgi:hypothetical protein
MATNIKLEGDSRIVVEEDPEAVVTALQTKGEGLAKLTLLHGTNKTPTGAVWVSLAQVQFVNEVG